MRRLGRYQCHLLTTFRKMSSGTLTTSVPSSRAWTTSFFSAVSSLMRIACSSDYRSAEANYVLVSSALCQRYPITH